MTTSASERRPTDRQRPIDGEDGRLIGTITAARAEWMGALLAECERGHVYVLPGDIQPWATTDSACPRCRTLGHGIPGDDGGNPHGD